MFYVGQKLGHPLKFVYPVLIIGISRVEDGQSLLRISCSFKSLKVALILVSIFGIMCYLMIACSG